MLVQIKISSPSYDQLDFYRNSICPNFNDGVKRTGSHTVGHHALITHSCKTHIGYICYSVITCFLNQFKFPAIKRMNDNYLICNLYIMQHIIPFSWLCLPMLLSFPLLKRILMQRIHHVRNTGPLIDIKELKQHTVYVNQHKCGTTDIHCCMW